MIGRAAARVRGPHPSYLVAMAIALAGACEVLFLLRRSDEWMQSQLAAIQWQGNSAQLLAPIAAAAAAAGAQAVGGSALGVIARVQQRDHACVSSTGLRFAIPLVLVHLVAMVVAVVVARGRGLEGAPPVAAWLPGALMIGAFGLVGAALGWRIRTVVAAPIAAALAFAVLVVVTVSLDVPALDVSGSPRVVGFALRGDWVVASALVAVLIALGALATTPAGRRPWLYALAAAAVLGIAVVSALGPSSSVRHDGTSVVCVGSAPQVCGYPERRRLLAPTGAAIRRIGDAIARLDPGVPRPLNRWSEGPIAGGAAVAPLEVADPHDHADLIDDVVSSIARCVPDDAFPDTDSVKVWVAREVYGPNDSSVATLAVGIPAPRLAAAALQQRARQALRSIQRHPCG